MSAPDTSGLGGRMSGPSLGVRSVLTPVLLFSMIAVGIAVEFLVSRLPSPDFLADSVPVSTVRVTATGERDPASKGSEVWVQRLTFADGSPLPLEMVSVDPAWERRGTVLVCYKDQPGSITIRGEFRQPVLLVLGMHPWSGFVEIDEGNRSERHNLFAAFSRSLERTFVGSRSIKRHLYNTATGITGALVVFLTWLCMRALRRLPYVATTARTVIVLFPAAFVTVASAPGIYTEDSTDQLNQAISGNYHDGHPPVMSILWAKLIALTGAPSSLFYLHVLFFAAGLLLWAAMMRRWKLPAAAACLAIVFCLPPLLAFVGVLWKDVGMAVALLVATALIAGGQLSRPWQTVAVAMALVLMMYAALVRWNALPAIVPLLIFLVYRADKSFLRNAFTTSAAVAVFMIATIASSAALRLIYEVKHVPLFQYIMLHDLAGISVRTGINHVPPNWWAREITIMDLERGYDPASSLYLFDTYDRGQPPLRVSIGQTELDRAWFDALLQHPLFYLAHRARVMAVLLGTPGLLDVFPQPKDASWNDSTLGSGLPGRLAATQIAKHAIWWTGGHTLLYSGYFWLAVLLAITPVGLAFARRSPSFSIAATLGASGLMYMAPYLFVAPATDFRYLYWPAFAAGLSTIIVAGSLHRIKSLLTYPSERTPAGEAFCALRSDYSRSGEVIYPDHRGRQGC